MARFLFGGSPAQRRGKLLSLIGILSVCLGIGIELIFQDPGRVADDESLPSSLSFRRVGVVVEASSSPFPRGRSRGLSTRQVLQDDDGALGADGAEAARRGKSSVASQSSGESSVVRKALREDLKTPLTSSKQVERTEGRRMAQNDSDEALKDEFASGSQDETNNLDLADESNPPTKSQHVSKPIAKHLLLQIRQLESPGVGAPILPKFSKISHITPKASQPSMILPIPSPISARLVPQVLGKPVLNGTSTQLPQVPQMGTQKVKVPFASPRQDAQKPPPTGMQHPTEGQPATEDTVPKASPDENHQTKRTGTAGKDDSNKDDGDSADDAKGHEEAEKESGSALPVGAIVGIVVLSVFVLFGLVTVTWCLWRDRAMHHRSKGRSSTQPAPGRAITVTVPARKGSEGRTSIFDPTTFRSLTSRRFQSIEALPSTRISRTRSGEGRTGASDTDSEYKRGLLKSQAPTSRSENGGERGVPTDSEGNNVEVREDENIGRV